MSHPNQQAIDALVARWDAFLGKIEATLQETLEEAEPALLEVITDPDGGTIPFLQSVSAVKSQIHLLTQKIEPTWRDTVRPRLEEASGAEGYDEAADGWGQLTQSSKGSELSDRSSEVVERWELIVCGKAAQKLQGVIDARARTSFRCTLCSADMEITENIYRAHYETCPFCDGKNTYEPSNELRETLWFVADHLARYQALPYWDALQEAHEAYRQARVPVPEHVIENLRSRHHSYYSQFLHFRIQVVPEFVETLEKDLARYDKEFEYYEIHGRGDQPTLPSFASDND